MTFKSLVALVVAALCGVVAAVLCNPSVWPTFSHSNSEDVEKVAILVAKKQIEAGAPLKLPHEMFEEKLFVKGEEPRDAICHFDDLKGRIIRRTLRHGDFIRWDDLLPKDPPVHFGGLPEGNRLHGLRLDKDAIQGKVSELLHAPVDLILFRDGTPTPSVVVEKVMLLEIAINVPRCCGDHAELVPFQITVSLSPEEILKVSLARESGKLHVRPHRTEKAEAPSRNADAICSKNALPAGYRAIGILADTSKVEGGRDGLGTRVDLLFSPASSILSGVVEGEVVYADIPRFRVYCDRSRSRTDGFQTVFVGMPPEDALRLTDFRERGTFAARRAVRE